MAGQLRVDEITDEAGTGSPSFPFGLPVGYAAGGTAPAAGSFTEVPSNVLEVGDPIRSSDIIAIKDNTLFLFDASISFPIIDQQRFDASGTWTKPNISTPEAATLITLLVGGGGAGAHQNYSPSFSLWGAAGGGSGGVVISSCNLNDAEASATVTIGAGGPSVTTTGADQDGDGSAGGNTIFSMNNGVVTANGGGGGRKYRTNAGNTGGSAGGASISGVFVGLLNRSKAGRQSMTVNVISTVFPQPVFSGGGGIAGSGTTPTFINADAGPAFSLFNLDNEPLMGAGGNGGSPTANNAQASGAGGGGAAAGSGTVTSGSGAIGCALVFVVRGVIDNQLFLDKYLQIP